LRITLAFPEVVVGQLPVVPASLGVAFAAALGALGALVGYLGGASAAVVVGAAAGAAVALLLDWGEAVAAHRLH
jgi:hypothetical protein